MMSAFGDVMILQKRTNAVWVQFVKSDGAEEMVKSKSKKIKSEVDVLKAWCEKKLASHLDLEKCLWNFITADSYQAFKLKKDALKVIISNRKAVFKSEDWKWCIKNYSSLSVEITRALV